VRGRLRARDFRWISAALAAALTLLTAAAASAEDPPSLRDEAARLEAENADLASRERSAVLELYALETRLARADRRVAELRARATEVERERGAAQERLALVRANLGAAEANLADRLRLLYVEGHPDPLEVLLGAQSLDEALTALDSLSHVARQDREIVAEVREARAEVTDALAALERRRDELAGLVTEAEAARDAVAAAREERSAYLAELRVQRSLNRADISDLLAAADSAEAKTAELEAPEPSPSGGSSPSPSPSPPPPPGPPDSGGRKLTVEATGYAIHGTTATGIQTGWGVVAVDPSVIPLGTRMFVPGYGEGVAADTGSAVKGNIIDLWFPTREQALEWGRRTVSITLY
jgi:3D (Asp-Asp-Asp) domain-containing protein/peptidoglycan hydrolase CwlO-like protein